MTDRTRPKDSDPRPIDRFCQVCQAHPGSGCVNTLGRPTKEHVKRRSGPTETPPERVGLKPRQALLPERPALPDVPSPSTEWGVSDPKTGMIGFQSLSEKGHYLLEQLVQAERRRQEAAVLVDYLKQELLGSGMDPHTVARRFRSNPELLGAPALSGLLELAAPIEVAEVVEVPGISYRQLVEFVEGERRWDAWMKLGLVVTTAGWRLELLPDAPAFHWVHPAEPRIWACAGNDDFDLIRQAPDDKDWAEMWTLQSPEQVLLLAELLVSGAPAPEPTVYLGRPDDWPDDEDEELPAPLPPIPGRALVADATF